MRTRNRSNNAYVSTSYIHFSGFSHLLLIFAICRAGPLEDERDEVVSVGGEEDDMNDMKELLALQSRTLNNVKPTDSPAKGAAPAKASKRESSNISVSRDERRDSATQPAPVSNSSSPTQTRMPPPPKRELMHALPPKPVVSPVSFRVHPSSSNLMEASAMSERRRVNGSPIRSASSDDLPRLPPHWEVRRPRGDDTGERVYYYNTQTQQSQWERPAADKPISSSSSRDVDQRHRSNSRSQADSLPSRDSQPAAKPDARVSRRLQSRSLSPRRGPPTSSIPNSFDDRNYAPAGPAELRSSGTRRRDHSADEPRGPRSRQTESTNPPLRPREQDRPTAPTYPRADGLPDRSNRDLRDSHSNYTEANAPRSQTSPRGPPRPLPQPNLPDRTLSDRRSTIHPPREESAKSHRPGPYEEAPSKLSRNTGNRTHQHDEPRMSLRSTLSALPLSSVPVPAISYTISLSLSLYAPYMRPSTTGPLAIQASL